MMKQVASIILCLLLTGISSSSYSGNSKHKLDTHYTPSGFFDIHYCSWPDQPPFYMALYSTEKFDSVKSVDIINSNNKTIGSLDLSRFKLVKVKGKPEKRVFIIQIEKPDNLKDGWFSAKVLLKNGVTHIAKDYVVHQIMPMATGQIPANNSEDIALPKKLKWSPIDGATYYQVFINDMWNDGKLIHSSKLLTKPEFNIPKNLLSHGGYYSWKIHARDVNEHIFLGDFNHGSISASVEFTVVEN